MGEKGVNDGNGSGVPGVFCFEFFMPTHHPLMTYQLSLLIEAQYVLILMAEMICLSF